MLSLESKERFIVILKVNKVFGSEKHLSCPVFKRMQLEHTNLVVAPHDSFLHSLLWSSYFSFAQMHFKFKNNPLKSTEKYSVVLN